MVARKSYSLRRHRGEAVRVLVYSLVRCGNSPTLVICKEEWCKLSCF